MKTNPMKSTTSNRLASASVKEKSKDKISNVDSLPVRQSEQASQIQSLGNQATNSPSPTKQSPLSKTGDTHDFQQRGLFSNVKTPGKGTPVSIEAIEMQRFRNEAFPVRRKRLSSGQLIPRAGKSTTKPIDWKTVKKQAMKMASPPALVDRMRKDILSREKDMLIRAEIKVSDKGTETEPTSSDTKVKN